MAEYIAGDNVGAATTTVTKPVNIQTAQANSWSNQAENLPFDAPDDPGSVTKMTEYTATFTFTTDPSTAETSVSCAIATGTGG